MWQAVLQTRYVKEQKIITSWNFCKRLDKNNPSQNHEIQGQCIKIHTDKFMCKTIALRFFYSRNMINEIKCILWKLSVSLSVRRKGYSRFIFYPLLLHASKKCFNIYYIGCYYKFISQKKKSWKCRGDFWYTGNITLKKSGAWS